MACAKDHRKAGRQVAAGLKLLHAVRWQAKHEASYIRHSEPFASRVSAHAREI